MMTFPVKHLKWFINKNTRRPKEEHNAQHLKEIRIIDRAGEDLEELDQHCTKEFEMNEKDEKRTRKLVPTFN